MTNQIAIFLAILLFLFFATDYIAFGGDISVFLGKKMVDLIHVVAFWR